MSSRQTPRPNNNNTNDDDDATAANPAAAASRVPDAWPSREEWRNLHNQIRPQQHPFDDFCELVVQGKLSVYKKADIEKIVRALNAMISTHGIFSPTHRFRQKLTSTGSMTKQTLAEVIRDVVLAPINDDNNSNSNSPGVTQGSAATRNKKNTNNNTINKMNKTPARRGRVGDDDNDDDEEDDEHRQAAHDDDGAASTNDPSPQRVSQEAQRQSFSGKNAAAGSSSVGAGAASARLGGVADENSASLRRRRAPLPSMDNHEAHGSNNSNGKIVPPTGQQQQPLPLKLDDDDDEHRAEHSAVKTERRSVNNNSINNSENRDDGENEEEDSDDALLFGTTTKTKTGRAPTPTPVSVMQTALNRAIEIIITTTSSSAATSNNNNNNSNGSTAIPRGPTGESSANLVQAFKLHGGPLIALRCNLQRFHLSPGAMSRDFTLPAGFHMTVEQRRSDRVILVPVVRSSFEPARWPMPPKENVTIRVNNERVSSGWRRMWPETRASGSSIQRAYLPVDITDKLLPQQRIQNINIDYPPQSGVNSREAVTYECDVMICVVTSVDPAVAARRMLEETCNGDPHRLAALAARVSFVYRHSLDPKLGGGVGGGTKKQNHKTNNNHADDDDDDDDDDVCVDSSRQNDGMVLRCPVSRSRIAVPVRGAQCTHLQCVDLVSYLKTASGQCFWNCAVCDRPMRHHDIIVDPLVLQALQDHPPSSSNANAFSLVPTGVLPAVTASTGAGAASCSASAASSSTTTTTTTTATSTARTSAAALNSATFAPTAVSVTLGVEAVWRPKTRNSASSVDDDLCFQADDGDDVDVLVAVQSEHHKSASHRPSSSSTTTTAMKQQRVGTATVFDRIPTAAAVPSSPAGAVLMMNNVAANHNISNKSSNTSRFSVLPSQQQQQQRGSTNTSTAVKNPLLRRQSTAQLSHVGNSKSTAIELD